MACPLKVEIACQVALFGDEGVCVSPFSESNNDRDCKEGNVDTNGMDKFDAMTWPIDPEHSFMHPVPFSVWVSQFLHWVSSAKTWFSCFVMRTISASRSGRNDITATAPEEALMDGLDPGRKRKKRAVAFLKLLHLDVMDLSFEWFKGPMSISQPI